MTNYDLRLSIIVEWRRIEPEILGKEEGLDGWAMEPLREVDFKFNLVEAY